LANLETVGRITFRLLARGPMYTDPVVEDRYASVNGVRLHYLDWGGDGEPLLFLPGNGEPASVFKWFAQRFSPEFRPIALTRRGIGKSEILTGPYAIDQLVHDINAFLDVIDIDQVSVIGHSLGGAEATFFAAEYLHRVRKLVNLEGIFISSEFRELYDQDPCAPSSEPITPIGALASVEAYVAYVRRTYPFMDRIWSPAVREVCIADLQTDQSGRVEVIDRRRAMCEAAQSARDKGLDFSQVPVLMLAIVAIEEHHPDIPPDATDDAKREADAFQTRVVEAKRATVQRIRREMPLAIFAEIIGAAHHCYISHEEVTYAHILEFLRQ
jgi:pimeloyl-ACP methyl ester carboxylesterase